MELLSPQGDVNRLLGQFAALLLFLGILFSLRVLGVDGRKPLHTVLIDAWGPEHSLIAATMLVVGIFAVLSWESTFPDLRDVLVLVPLPVRPHIFFLAKVAALACSLAVTVVALNSMTSVALLLALPSDNLLDLLLSPARYRLFVAYWVTVLSAGTFVFCSVLGLQGLAVQILPRQWYLRLSAVLQIAAFCLLLSLYLLEPSWITPEALSAPGHRHSLMWLPSYWFLGLLQELNGFRHESMAGLSERAWYGLGIAATVAASMYLLSYFRTLRRIAETPDIVRGSLVLRWLPAWGGSLGTAILHFSIRTVLRSRRHRVLMAFYLGTSFAVIVLFLALPRSRQQISVDQIRQIFSSITTLCACVVGTRVVFGIPLDIRANWIFRLTEVRPVQDYFQAIRPPLFAIGIAPVWLASAVFFLWTWDWLLAVEHLMVLALLGAALGFLGLHGFQKIPFTCSWRPGKAYFHMAFLAVLGCLLLIGKGAAFEYGALRSARAFANLVLLLGVVLVVIRWRTLAAANGSELRVPFDDSEPPVILGLGLNEK